MRPLQSSWSVAAVMLSFGQALGEPLYRVSTGNYEYRLVLRCRQEARARFAKMRKDVLEKMELLDQKHGEWGCPSSVVQQLVSKP